MADHLTYKRLDLNDRPQLQERMWGVQRAGWAVLCGFGILALAGGLGDGWLGTQEVRTRSAIVTYARIVRLGNPARIEIAGRTSPVAVRFSADFFQKARLHEPLAVGVIPRPDSTGGVVLTRDGGTILAIDFTVRTLGELDFQIRIGDEIVPLRIWALP
jgi:hypothetical protein